MGHVRATPAIATLGLAAALVLLLTESPALAQDDLVDLLRIETATVESSRALSIGDADLGPMTDGNAATAISVPATVDVPLDVVYGFGGRTVAPEQIVVRLPADQPTGSLAGRIEILASMLSATAGFQSLRAERTQPGNQPQRFSFPPAAARWIMIRLTPGGDGRRVSVSEVSVLGRRGPPATQYAFKESPAAAFDVLARLKESVDVSLTEDERALFADARDGQLDEFSLAEAALLASGVTDRAARQAYLAKIDELEATAILMTAGGRTPFERGLHLLKWLHDEPMAGGYSADQTDLSTVLDTGAFNCVSSAVLYNVLGRRLGLDLRAIEVPDHAFSIIYDGSEHADVETTTPLGFNPSRDRLAQEQFTRRTGFRYIAERHRDKRREIGETGLVALIWYNHGVKLSKAKRFGEALTSYFRALNLDPQFASAVRNVLAALANWSVELSRAGEFEEAVNVVNTGLALAPDDATLVNNRRAVWIGWAEAAMKNGDDAEALAILRRAADEVPDGGFSAFQSWVFIRPGEELTKAGKWSLALALAQRGLEKVDGDARNELHQWQTGLVLRWFADEVGRHEYEPALKVIDTGLKLEPEEVRFAHNLGYLAQQWSWTIYRERGLAEAEALLVKLRKSHPGAGQIDDVANTFVHRAVEDLRKNGEPERAMAAISAAGHLLSDKDEAKSLVRITCDDWARDLANRNQWQEAVGVYETGLKRFRGDPHLEHNAVATWDSWITALTGVKDWAAAAATCQAALKRRPDSDRFRRKMGYLAQEWSSHAYQEDGVERAKAVLTDLNRTCPNVPSVRDATKNFVFRTVGQLIDGKQYEDAVAILDIVAPLLEDDEQALELARNIHDRWADNHSSRKKWKLAVDVYAKALKRYPGDAHLNRNATATWDSWAKQHISAKEWPQAVEVYQKALAEFPDNGHLKNNLEYCKQKQGS